MNWQTKEVIDWLKEDKDFFLGKYSLDVSKLRTTELKEEVKLLLLIKGRILETAAIDHLKNQAIKQILKDVAWEEVLESLQQRKTGDRLRG